MQQLVKFTFHHDYGEDRIRMLAQCDDGGRVAFWLTRRLTGNLLESAQRWLMDAYASQHNMPLQAQEQLYEMYHGQARSDFEQQQLMRPQAAVEDDVALVQLVSRIELSLLGDDELQLTFCQDDKELAGMQCTVGHFHQLLHILQNKAEALDWQLQPVSTEGNYALQ